MLPLLLTSAVLIGSSFSSGVGETGSALAFAADVRRGAWGAEVWGDNSRKIGVPGEAYLLHGGVDWTPAGGVFVGVGQSYRHTSAWSKRITWVRAGLHSGPLTLIAEAAPASRNQEMKLEARLRHCHHHVCLEVRGWLMDHSQAGPTLGHGVMALAGVRLGR
jgi:hypothetical protein